MTIQKIYAILIIENEREVNKMKDISTTIAMVMATITFLIKVFFIAVLLWTVVSLVDVSIHNFTTIYTYSEWNLFEILFHINH